MNKKDLQTKVEDQFTKDDLQALIKSTKERLGVNNEEAAIMSAQSLIDLLGLIKKIKKSDPAKIAAKVDSYLKNKK